MKACFVHDFPMIVRGEHVYSLGGFPYKVWERYLKVFSELTVIGRRGQGDDIPLEKLILSSGPSVQFKTVPNLSSLRGKMTQKRKAIEIIRYQLEQSDALIARLPSELGTLTVSIAKQLNIPYLIEVVGCGFNAYWHYGSLLGKLYAPISYIKTKRTVRKSKYTIYVTKKYLQERYPSFGEQENISNVEISPTKQEVLEKRLKVTKNFKNKLRIGTIANIDIKYKGVHIAIDAMKIIKDKGYDFEYHILGNGNKNHYSKQIKNHDLEKHIIFAGSLSSREEVNNWLDQIDIYVQPSLTEGLPRAVIEAMNRGCPCVCTNVGGIPELISEEYLVYKNNPKQLATQIIKLIKNKKKCEEQSILNFENSKSYYNDKLEDKRIKFLQKFVQAEIKH